MAKYKLTTSGGIHRITDGAAIPTDPGNTDYAEYLAWTAEGNTPDPVDPPTAEELAAAAAEVQYKADAAAAKAYTKLKALSTMTPAQVQTWVAANVTNLAQAQDAITTLAIAVSILSRRL